MREWHEIDDQNGILWPKPTDEQIVELKLRDGSIVRSMFWYGGADEWDFVAEDENDENTSYLETMVAWRSAN